MLNLLKRPTPDSLRQRLLEEHQRQLLTAELAFEHAKANLRMQRAIVTRLECDAGSEHLDNEQATS